jgi:hypothetical protein
MAAIDFDRSPTRVYDTVRRSFEPVLASIEYEQDRWPVGAAFRCGVWAINDRWSSVPNTTVSWRILDAAEHVCQRGEWRVSMDPDSVQRLGDATWTTLSPGSYQLRAEIRSETGTLVSENVFHFEVAPDVRIAVPR